MKIDQQSRSASITRKTGETDIEISFVCDGSGEAVIESSVPFLDHMLTLFAVHGFFNLQVKASGDVEIDDHHTVEDVGICLGQAVAQALGDKSGIKRYGLSYVPMDETLVRVVVDISNRPYLHYGIAVPDQKVGRFDTSLAKEFMRAFAQHSGITLHADMLHGENSHHIIEALFKALGKALDEATKLLDKTTAPLSSKGSL